MHQKHTSTHSHTLCGHVVIPGDKSISHRALLCGLLTLGKTHIINILTSDDVTKTRKACEILGATITESTQGIYIDGVGIGGIKQPRDIINVGNSGTTTRLLSGILASHDITATLNGDNSLNTRPMQRIITPLSLMGGQFITNTHTLPMMIKGTNLPTPITYLMPVASAQVKSAILFAALATKGTTTVIETIETRDHTERMLLKCGANIHITHKNNQKHIAIVGPCILQPKTIHVPGDISSALFFITAALICKDSHIILENICANLSRTKIIDILQNMGCQLKITSQNNLDQTEEPTMNIEVIYQPHLRSIFISADIAPLIIDEIPILAILASYAEGTSHFEGLKELRVKESDRLAAIFNGLQQNKINCSMTDDTLTIHGTHGKMIGGGNVTTHNDHRIAMSFLVMGLATTHPVTVDDITSINTSFPTFLKEMLKIGARIQAT